MIKKPITAVIACSCVFVLVQYLAPKAVAIKSSSNIDEFTVENQRTRKKQNYILHKNKGILRDKDSFGMAYNTEPFELEANPEELSAFIVDYANMIRNDVILLDNSVETRTRKRGNIKVEKYNQAIPDPPCSCEYIKDTMYLGENVYPQNVEVRNCSAVQQQSCLPPYICKESLYNLTILKRRGSQKLSDDIPGDLRLHWIPDKRTISVGCICARDYVI